MSNDRSREDDDLSTADSFEQWLDRQAAEEEVTREQLFEQLISSYWTLNEMEQLLAGSDGDGRSRDRRGGSDGPDDGKRGADASGGDDGDDLEAVADRLEALEAELDAEVEHRQSLDTLVEMTTDRLTDVEETLEEVTGDRLADVEETLDELTAEVEEVRDAVDRKHESVAERADALAAELEREQEARATEQRELAAEQERLADRLDSEFENLETILSYLVSRTDELEAGISNVESEQRQALTRLRSERDALDTIKREAMEAGVDFGECESCDEEIDLGMLSRPYCPECETALTGVEERQKWLFFSDAVVTTEDEPGDGSPRSGDRAVPREDPPRSSPDPEGGPSQSEANAGRSRRRDPSDPDAGTDPADSRFEYGVVSDEPSGRDRERNRSRQDARRTGERSEDGRGRSEGGTDPDDPDSPFGDLSDLRDGE